MRLSWLAAIAALAAAAGPADAAERLAFPSGEPNGQWQLELADPVGGGAQPFAASPLRLLDPSWSPDDKTIAYDEGFGQRIVLKPVGGGAERTFATNAGRPSWSPVVNEIAYWVAPEAYQYVLKVTTADGQTTRTVAGPYDARFDFPPVEFSHPAWSADGKTIAFALSRGIYKVPATGGQVTQLVAGGPTNTYVVDQPSFAPDGRQLAYVKSFDSQGGFPAWQVVVRDLQNGQEHPIASGTSSAGDTSNGGIGPQAWSPDSDEVAYSEGRTIGTRTPLTHEGTVRIARSDGASSRTVVRREFVWPPAWGGGGPNYYIKHVEATQAISPHLAAVAPRDPLSSEPYSIQWPESTAFGFGIPLIAEKSTLLRVYIGDASLAKGATERRSLRVSVIDDGSSIEYGRPTPREVDVTAPDVLPLQEGEQSAVNVWVPPEAIRPGAPRSFTIHVNVDQEEPECADCYPNGNRARLEDVRAADGGNLVIAPVAITVVGKNGEPWRRPSEQALRDGFEEAIPALPVRDDGVTFTPPPGDLFVLKEDLTLADGCSKLLKALLNLKASPGVAGPVEGYGATRWVGYAPPWDVPSGTTACRGRADTTSNKSFAVFGYDSETLAHEFGHTLGLTHTIGVEPSKVPLFALPLPYAGIGGVGTQVGVGGVTEIFQSARTGDLMSYDSTRWTSPKTWNVMFNRVLAESGAIKSTGADRLARAAAGTPAAGKPAAGKPAVRRLVSGILRGKNTEIDSFVAEAGSLTTFGPSAARIVATNSRGQVVARAVVRGTPYQEDGETSATLPFLAALPNKKSIASLQVLPMRGGKPLARLRASKHAPKGRFLKLPRRGRAKRPLTVRWKASDRDRRDDLSVMLLARRGNSGWRTIVLGPASGRIAVEPSTLGKGKALRLRLRVSDGFHTTATTRSLKLKR